MYFVVTVDYTMNEWSFLPPRLKLGDSDVHVWLTNLDAFVNDVSSFEPLLAADERQRAARFCFVHDRNRYIIGRGQLRLLLGRYLDCPPTTLKFQYTHYGKPTLTEHPQLHFNVSNAGSYALFGFVLNREIGIDIDLIKSNFDVTDLAVHFFSSQENRHLRSLPESQRRNAFFSCWTRKEAYIKARGDGLSLPLSQFDVSLLPGEPAQLMATRPEASEASRWKMADLDVPNGYKGALIVEGQDWQLVLWEIPK